MANELQTPVEKDESNYQFAAIILSLVAFLFITLPSYALAVLSFLTITVPTTIYSLLSWSFTLRVSFTTLLVLLAGVATITTIVVRYKYLTIYSKLKTAPIAIDDTFDLKPVSESIDDNKSGFHNYLDEFLSAIKIFGYLEKPVFHELARHLQTRKLVAGDTLSLGQDRSFYVVVDGLVQVYIKTSEPSDKEEEGFIENEDEANGYTLLNEVGSGGTLSSLFSILSLFTDQVKIRYEEYSPECPDSGSVSPQHLAMHGLPSSANDASPPLDLPRSRRQSQLKSPTFSMMDSSPFARLSEERRKTDSAGPINLNIVARATVDTTLAWLPPEAFQRLTNKFPNAAAHMVQVILTRFQRVTFLASHKYLGLTKEILRAEKAINEMAVYALPRPFFENGGMAKLRKEFDEPGQNARDTLQEHYEPNKADHSTPSDTYYALNPPILGHRPSFSIETSRSHFVDPQNVHKRSKRSYGNSSPKTKPILPRDILRRSSLNNSDSSLLPESKFSLHDEVRDCILKSIGCVQNAVSIRDSLEHSPRLQPQDTVFHRAVFNSAFSGGSLSAEVPDDISVQSTSSSSHQQAILTDLDIGIQIMKFNKDEVLIAQGEHDAGIYYVIDGFLDVFIEDSDQIEPQKRRFLFGVKPGGIAGYLASLSGQPSYVEIRAKTDVYAGFLSSETLNRIMARQPIVLLTLAKRLLSLLSPSVLHIDFALEWIQAPGRHIIYRQGDRSDDIYLVLNGRMRTIREKDDGSIDVISEIGHGESVGELEVLTATPRASTLHAIRDSELCRIPKTLFRALAKEHPETTMRISKLIASKFRQQYESTPRIAPIHSSTGYVSGLNPGNEINFNMMNLKTVAIVPVSSTVPIVEFARHLREALQGILKSVSFLNQSVVLKAMGKHAFSRMGNLKLATWLADQEESHDIVLYLADTAVNSAWTQTVIRQADCIILVAVGDADTSLGEYERMMLSLKPTARKELVLLHEERYCHPGLTREWLKNRPWIHAHHHLQMSMTLNREVVIRRMTRRPTSYRVRAAAKDVVQNIRERVQNEVEKYTGRSMVKKSSVQKPSHNDFQRLARRLCGKAVGLVLGGGGARGISHIGFIRALEEANIPIDMVGGTSIGAYVGGLYARDADVVSIIGRAKKFCGRMSSLWRQVSDVTYPFSSYTTGHEFNRGIYKSFYNTQIEDLWLPYYAVTTNITWSRKEIHLQGYAWRYVRASMTLAGFLPPICDNGSLLMDGGYLDNVPVTTMRAMGAHQIIAIDVGRMDDTNPHDYGDSLSGWWIMLNKFNPFSRHPTPPSIAEIQSRLAYVSSANALEEAKKIPGVLYTRPPVQGYGTLEFGKFDEILDVGYEHGKKMVSEWKAADKFAQLGGVERQDTAVNRSGRLGRRNSV